MRKRQIRSGQLMQELALVELNKMLSEANETKKKRGSLDEKTILKLLEQGSKLERINYGEPGEIIENTAQESTVDLSVLSTAELRALRGMRGKLKLQADAEAEEDGDGE